MQHIKDDKASGWNGARIEFDVEEHIEWEKRAYQVEIDNALKLGRNDIAKLLEENLNDEIQRLRETLE